MNKIEIVFFGERDECTVTSLNDDKASSRTFNVQSNKVMIEHVSELVMDMINPGTDWHHSFNTAIKFIKDKGLEEEYRLLK